MSEAPNERYGRHTLEGNFSGDAEASNLIYRWMAYEHCEPRVDWGLETYLALDLTPQGSESILDVGTGPGHTLFRLRYKYGHQGRLVGIEPNIDQLDDGGIWQSVGAPIWEIFEDIELKKGYAQELPVDDHSMDRVLARRVLNFIDEADLDQVFREISRVLVKDGKFVAETSGPHNKIVQRAGEKYIADVLGIEPPPIMNRTYDSIRAGQDLRRRFARVVHKPIHRKIVYYESSLDIALLSMSSMKDQFHPIPRESEFQAARTEWVARKVQPELKEFGKFTDFCEWDIFTASDPLPAI